MDGRAVAVVLLLAALGALGWFLRGNVRGWRALRPLVSGDPRATRYRFWIAKAGIAFALPTVGGLAILGRLPAIAALPPEFVPLRAYVPDYHDLRPLILGALGGLALGMVLVALVQRFRSGRPAWTLGNVGVLMPRTRGELRYGALLAIVAGVVEEGFFRLFLPLTIVLAGGDPRLGFVVASLLFGAVHLYQGWKGVAATTVFGVLMAIAYLGTGALWVAVLLHVVLDLNGLVVRPLIGGVWRVR